MNVLCRGKVSYGGHGCHGRHKQHDVIVVMHIMGGISFMDIMAVTTSVYVDGIIYATNVKYLIGPMSIDVIENFGFTGNQQLKEIPSCQWCSECIILGYDVYLLVLWAPCRRGSFFAAYILSMSYISRILCILCTSHTSCISRTS